MYARMPTDAEWVSSRVAGLPLAWERRLRRAWERRSPTDYYGANVELREATASLQRVRIPLDASDAEVCDAADALAARCLERLTITHTRAEARCAMERVCEGQGVMPPAAKVGDGPAMARMCCPKWWRSKLRKHQGQTVESAAVRLGLVNKQRGPYISYERLRARKQQNTRNAATLEATTARNEDGQVFTLAELAAKSPANKTIRRAELMTRISGFERYADAEGHQGVFVTITCPSRFHRYLLVNDGALAVKNPKYDARETPRTGHDHLVNVWARARAELARKGIRPYGFRISEPQHDETPHWHLLVFAPIDQIDSLISVLRKQAMKDSGDERGADEHRCDFKLIDKAQGTAAGYIAKYVAKNIDGAYVGNDLDGRPATDAAERVDAWASTWRIRQFQQVGGPTVSVWRELRRIASMPEDAPEYVHRAHRAANKRIQEDGDETARVSWETYCRAQGGTGSGRKAPIRMALRQAAAVGRYGDATGLRPYGIQVAVSGSETVDHASQPPRVIESERRTWIVEPRIPTRRLDWRAFSAASAQPAQPWTRVNNCTAIDYARLSTVSMQYVSTESPPALQGLVPRPSLHSPLQAALRHVSALTPESPYLVRDSTSAES